MEINWWSDKSWKESPRFGDAYEFYLHPVRQFVEIHLTGNDIEDKIKLDFAQLEVRQIVAKNDTIKGVHFHFGDHSKYWTLVRALDICFIEKAGTFVPNGNDLWMFRFIPKPRLKQKRNYSFCGGNFKGMEAEFASEEQIENKKKAKIDFIINATKAFWLSGFLFILMIILTIRKIINIGR